MTTYLTRSTLSLPRLPIITAFPPPLPLPLSCYAPPSPSLRLLFGFLYSPCLYTFDRSVFTTGFRSNTKLSFSRIFLPCALLMATLCLPVLSTCTLYDCGILLDREDTTIAKSSCVKRHRLEDTSCRGYVKQGIYRSQKRRIYALTYPRVLAVTRNKQSNTGHTQQCNTQNSGLLQPLPSPIRPPSLV